MEFDPEREITICCGATKGMIASLLAVLDPGDEVVLFAPFYENYGPDTQPCGATARYVSLRPPEWHVGWVLAPPDLTGSIRKVHDFLTVGAAAPLQQAGVLALGLPDSYYLQLSQEYATRDPLVTSLQSAGSYSFILPGAYYVMTDISSFGFAEDASFVRHLITHVGVEVVLWSSFFRM